MWRKLQMAFLDTREHNKPSLTLYSGAADMDNMPHTEAEGEIVYEPSSVREGWYIQVKAPAAEQQS